MRSISDFMINFNLRSLNISFAYFPCIKKPIQLCFEWNVIIYNSTVKKYKSPSIDTKQWMAFVVWNLIRRSSNIRSNLKYEMKISRMYFWTFWKLWFHIIVGARKCSILDFIYILWYLDFGFLWALTETICIISN